MRIQTAADSLLPAPDTAAGQTESTDKGLFARLLQAQPESGQVLSGADSHQPVVAKVATALPAGEVNTDAAKPKAKPDAASTVATTPVSAEAEVAAITTAISKSATPTLAAPIAATPIATPAPVTLTTLATGEPAKAVELPDAVADVVADMQLESSDAKPGNAVATTVTTTAGSTRAAPERTAAALTSSLPTAPASDKASRPTLIPNPVLAPVFQKNTADRATPAESGQKPLTQPAGKATQKSRSTRDAHATAASTIASTDPQVTATALTDANAAAGNPNPQTAVVANPATAKQEALRTADDTAASATAVTIQPCANPAAANTPQPAVTNAGTLPMTTQNLPADTLQAISATVSSNDTATVRGTKLPPGGKSLPSSAEDQETTSQTPGLHAFKELADLASSQNPAPAADGTTLQANQNVINAAAGNLLSQESGPVQPATNSTGTSFATPPADAARVVNTGSTQIQAPLAFASGLAMTSNGWGEETVQHIRWLKDHDQQSAEIQLHPAELGRLSISIDIKDGQASVQLMAGNAEARDLLEKSLPDLRNLLAQSGMSLTDSGVAQHSGGQQAWSNRFNPVWFAADELKPLELVTGKPALFRSAGGSHRIDQYV